MTTMTGMAAANETIKDRLAPTMDAIEDNIRRTRRAITKGRHAAEDLVDQAKLGVRRRPLATVAVATGAGVLAGCLMGYLMGRRRH